MSRHWKLSVVAIAAVITAGSLVSAFARPRRPARPEEVIIIGRIVDLQSYFSGEYASDDPTRETRDNIRAGVPAGLEIDDGVVVIGMGKQNPARKLLPLAYQEVELTGKLYEVDGLLYVDMQDVKSVGGEEPARGEAPTEPPTRQPVPDENPE